jgi:large subunit ribosomal protein L12
MENIYSALILNSLGKDISEDAIDAIVSAAGGSPDANQIKVLVKAIGEMNLKDVLASAAMVAAAPAAAPAGAPAEEKKGKGKKGEDKEEKKEEKVEEPVGLDALFG